MSDYPGALDNFTNGVSGQPLSSPSLVDRVNELNAAARAIQETLGLNPQASNATVAARLDAVSVPLGGIILWSGAADAIPEFYQLCNGTNGTPDLRGRFVVGAGDSYAVGSAGGVNTVTLTADEIPGHTHTGPSHTHTGPSHTHAPGTFSPANSNGAHVHTQNLTTGEPSATHAHLSTARASAAPNNMDTMLVNNNNGEINSAGAHTHTITGATAASGTGNTNASGTGNTGSTGSGNSHENRPPFYALAYIQRIA